MKSRTLLFSSMSESTNPEAPVVVVVVVVVVVTAKEQQLDMKKSITNLFRFVYKSRRLM